MRQPIAPTGRVDIVSPATGAVLISLPTKRPKAEAVAIAEGMALHRGWSVQYVPIETGPAALRAPSVVSP